MKPGLLILPSDCTQRYKVVPESADYACIRCSEIIHMKAGKNNYVRAVQIRRMDEGKSGKTGDLTVKTSAFC